MIREIQSLMNRSIADGFARSVTLSTVTLDNNSGVCCDDAVSSVVSRSTRHELLASEMRATTTSTGGTSRVSGSISSPSVGPGGSEDEVIVSADSELDADLERELFAQADDLLDTVEIVRLSEDGRTTTVTRLGCLGKRYVLFLSLSFIVRGIQPGRLLVVNFFFITTSEMTVKHTVPD
ncbi:unnamed protein product [Echinostoma caproni]|uniref:Uncharacterized protein n=1 Tax=Echinostoma caproni TaxID=27848 RepID=A0A183AXJ2_9TREM|nr:unnamed protein product [Echinostoma caproni]